ncbi:MAG TPA: gephyrin-like molybdotransferase Glp [Chloroflexota bacterium]
MRASPYAMIDPHLALRVVMEHTPVLEPETARAVEAQGRVLAEDVVSEEDMPPFDAATVDGYAVVAGDETPWRRLLADVTAGRPTDLAVTPGTAMRIMTGAPLPPGADAVVMLEHATERDGAVQIHRAVKPGDFVQRRGNDIARGQVVLARGATLGPAEIGLLATLGRLQVRVHRRPRVAVLSTGDELVEPWEPRRPGSIRDSNRYALVAAIREAGAEPISLGIAHDDRALQEERIRQGLAEADVLVTSGGVSVGTRDLIKPILERLGTVHFGRIALKPGKPLTFATVGSKLVFGLPGFPVSSLVTFEVFVRPALRKMQGDPRPFRPRVQVTLEHDIKQTPERTEYQRAVVRWVEGRLLARTTGVQVSSRLLSMVGANALVVVPPGEGVVPAGGILEALLVGPIEGS